MTLGGGAEVCLPAAHIQASHETYMGLVEVGVGLNSRRRRKLSSI